MQSANRLPASAQWCGGLAVAWLLLDSLLTYFIKHWAGYLPPVNALLIVILLVVVMAWGMRAILPPTHIVVLLFAAVLSMLGSTVFHGELDLRRVGEIILSLSAFLVAFFAFRWNDNAEFYRNVFLAVALVYVAVCVAALLQVAPAVFPVVNAVWSNNGVLELRPEVTTDQNFQVYYLLPLALLIMLPFKPLRSAITVIGAVAALFVLAKLQTRSGVLVFAATVALALLAPLWTHALGRRKILLLPVLFVIAAALNHELILQSGSQLIARFNDSSANTGYSRWLAFMFTIQHMADPAWWLPRGTQEFVERFGYLPHSNITAMFLEGGLAGLIMWLGVFVFPLAVLGRLFLQGRLDVLATVILLGGIASLVIQLSLNVPFFKQPWLWAGAVVGTLLRVRTDHAGAAAAKLPEKPRVSSSVRYAKTGARP